MRRLLATVAALACTAGSANAYVVLKNWQGNNEQWAGATVAWTISTSVMGDVPFAALQAALKGAFDAWQSVDCATVQFSYGGQKASDPQNGVHFTFRENGWDPSVADALAYTVSETDGAGTISSSDIVFNAYDATWNVNYPTPYSYRDIQGVATHEIGHALGIDHTRTFGATMFFSGGDSGLRTLDPDDQRAACFLYPTTAFKNGQACDACDTSSNCAAGTCLDWGGGHAYCGKNCGAGAPCPDGFTCYEIQGVATPQCIPDNEFCHDYGGKAARGDSCYGNQVCASGTCLALDGEAYCSDTCNANNPASCGAGWTCMAPGYCLKAGSAAYGDACQQSEDCATAQCVFFQLDKGVCTEACGGRAGGCPNGDRCYKDAACVPPGDYGVGTPCYAPDQCRGMYCESSVCTQTCGGGCPAGTTCTGGYCVGAEIGAACTPTGQCPTGLKCFRPNAASLGTCQRNCDPFTDTDCAGGEVCRWSWDPPTQKILGQCVAANGGAGLKESCAERSCEANLVCHEVAGTGPLCLNDCRLAGAYGCKLTETCESLGDAADPQRGVCVPKEATPVDPGPEAAELETPENEAETWGASETDAPDGDPVTQPDVTASDDVATGVDTGAVATTTAPVGGDHSGCAGGGDAGVGVVVAALAVWIARRRALQGLRPCESG